VAAANGDRVRSNPNADGHMRDVSRVAAKNGRRLRSNPLRSISALTGGRSGVRPSIHRNWTQGRRSGITARNLWGITR
jgi:hypothetical protein